MDKYSELRLDHRTYLDTYSNYGFKEYQVASALIII